ncbi:MAG TPA: 50S ribosomal protein L16 [Candidatus Saccharimonadales bacterium]|nr:50S ribosomal protein L16 [Candidatus Saccharimonadales bacterium]HSX48821.1 50S ribosomal protein L16 [Candidatus Saccharimonadales bacterium]
MLQPKRRKFRKDFRGRRTGVSLRGSTLAFGDYGVKAMGEAWMSAAQIESVRRTVTGALKRKGRVWLRVFPDKPVTGRAAGQRMGSGKGDIDRYVAVVRPGRMIMEVAGVPAETAKAALKEATYKMPFKTKIVDGGEN